MTYDGYRVVFYVGLVLAIVFFAVTIILFFALKIREVIGDITGRTARNAIKEIRGSSESTGISSNVSTHKKDKKNKKQKSSKVPAKPIVQSTAPAMTSGEETSLLGEPTGSETAVLDTVSPGAGQETAVLTDAQPAIQAPVKVEPVIQPAPAPAPVPAPVPMPAPAPVPAAAPAPVVPQQPVAAPAAPVVPVKSKAEIKAEAKAEARARAEAKAEAKEEAKREKAAKKEEKKHIKEQPSANMYIPDNTYISTPSDSGQTSDLSDMPAPISAQQFDNSAMNMNDFMPYQLFEVEFDMTMAESVEIIP